MIFSPSLDTVKKIADTKKYDILPVSCEILSDICTPIEAITTLKNVSTHCYMLESVAEKEKWGRYTFLGFEPKMQITASGSELIINGVKIQVFRYVRYSMDTRVLNLTIYRHLQADLSATSLTISSLTPKSHCAFRLKTVKTSKMST